MAKFKPYKILESQLDSLPIKEGQFILTTDTNKLYSDVAENERILISPDAITDLSINGKIITYTRLDGTTGTITTQDTTYTVASDTKNGLMSSEDKIKLNAIESGAQKNTVTGIKGDSESLYRTGNINITKANIGLGNVENKSSATIREEITSANITTALGFTPINAELKGVNGGIAELDSAGKVPASQLPSYVDDVVEYDTKSGFPTTGEAGKLYIDISTNKTYRWSGTTYVDIGTSVALGTTSSTAFRGDYGNAAYQHAVTNKGQAFSSGLYKITTNAEGHVTSATAAVKTDITALGIPAQDTTYGAASTSSAGLMSASDKEKLDGIAAGAQKNTITGVKGSAETSYRTGNVNITAANIGLGNVENKSSETIRGELTKANVTTALGYTPPTTDTNTTYTLTQDSNNGHKITLTPSSGNPTTITIPDNNTTYEEATTSKAGLMSTTMVTKLNGIEAGAQKNTITGIKGNSETEYRTGNINITKENIGLGNVDNTADADKSVKSAVSATKDSASQQINTTYIKNVSVPGQRITLTKGDGTTTSVENFTTTVNINTANIWVKLGTFNNKTQGEGGEIWLFGGQGQNNATNQNMWAHLFIKKGYQGTTASTTNYVAATYEIFTPPAQASKYKDVKFKVFCTEVGVVDVWVFFPYTYSRSYYYPAGQYDSFTVANTYQTEEPVAGDTYGVLQPISGGIIASSSNGTSIDNVIKGLSISGKTITYTKGDDTTGTLTTQDTTYTGENGVAISGTVISNSGVRSIATGTSNGTISVNTNGTSENVAVKGLANAAYKNVDTTIDAASTSANLPTSAAVASFVEGKGYKTTDNNTTYTFATGDANGQIKVTPSGGNAQNVSVKGLGSLAYKSSLAASDVGAIASTSKGTANGVAELDANGKVPTSQLPSYVDDTIEGYLYNSEFYKESAHTTQITGETGKIYVDLSTNKTYRWSGSAFVEISASLALGTTSSTAFRGDYGNTAYTHATDSNRLTTATASGLYKVASTANGHIASLTAVTKSDITGLGIPGTNSATVGSDVKPVYVNNGVVTEGKYTLGVACQNGVDNYNTVGSLMGLTEWQSSTNLTTRNTIAHWDGSYESSSHSSNLAYCKKGLIGDIVTINKNNNVSHFLRGDGAWTTPTHIGYRWSVVTHGQTWSRVYYATPGTNVEGTNGIFTATCTRGNVVCNATFLITTSHAQVGQIVQLGSNSYTQFQIRLVVGSNGDYYCEIYDNANGISVGNTQTWHCVYIPIAPLNSMNAYTAFTDGTTVPNGLTIQSSMLTSKGDDTVAIKNITRSGTTFTAYRQNGTSFTFTQQDNDTKNTAGSTDTSSKIFLVGATSQDANPQTYSDNEVYATDGVLTAKSLSVNAKANFEYDTTSGGLKVVFA